MKRPVLTIGVGVWLATAALWPHASWADDEREHHIQVEEDDDGYEVRERETHYNDDDADEDVHVEERVETHDDGYEVHRRIEREHDD